MEPSAGMLPALPAPARSLASHDYFHPSSNKYPHQYKGLDAGVSFTCSKPWNEFPVLKSGAVFDGSTGPGPDRVVYEYVIPFPLQ